MKITNSASLKGLGELRCESMHGQNVGGSFGMIDCKTRRNFPTDSRRHPARVPVTDDEFAVFHPRFTSSSSVPPASSS